MIPRRRKDPIAFFSFRSENFSKLYAKRPKFKTLWPMPETSVARINPEINIMLSGQVVEGNLSPDST